MSDIGRWLIFMGILIAAAGVVITFAGKIPWLGKLPGDIYIKRENFSIYIPLATSILLSVIISLILWLIKK